MDIVSVLVEKIVSKSLDIVSVLVAIGYKAIVSKSMENVAVLLGENKSKQSLKLE
jgi:hypothetical protein